MISLFPAAGRAMSNNASKVFLFSIVCSKEPANLIMEFTVISIGDRHNSFKFGGSSGFAVMTAWQHPVLLSAIPGWTKNVAGISISRSSEIANL